MRFREYPPYVADYVKAKNARKAILAYLNVNVGNSTWHNVVMDDVAPIVEKSRGKYYIENGRLLPNVKGVVYYRITPEAIEAMEKTGVKFKWTQEKEN